MPSSNAIPIATLTTPIKAIKNGLESSSFGSQQLFTDGKGGEIFAFIVKELMSLVSDLQGNRT
jgi:hypothetical protein